MPSRTRARFRCARPSQRSSPTLKKQHCTAAADRIPLYNAVRLARAYTGRQKILKFEGGYHGWHDELALSVRPSAEQVAHQIRSARSLFRPGRLPEHARTRWSPRSTMRRSPRRLVKEHGKDLAAIFIEPVAHSCGCLLMKPGFLKFVRERCDATGCLLVFDEIITGFRHGLEGAGAREGVYPDLGGLRQGDGEWLRHRGPYRAGTRLCRCMAPEGPELLFRHLQRPSALRRRLPEDHRDHAHRAGSSEAVPTGQR